MTRNPQMFARPPRKMKQPRKDDLRRRLEVAEATVAYIKGLPWWQRMLGRWFV